MKFEFGDLYKFFVSLGVVLIALSIITPWLFLREPFDLFKTEKEVSELTSVAQETISERQALALEIVHVLPIFSIVGVALGIIFGLFGLYRWYQNQHILDERTRVELALSKLSLRNATPDEIESRREREAEETVEQAGTLVKEEDLPSARIISEAVNIERKLVSRFQEVLGSNYDVLTERIVGGAFVDVVLRGKDLSTKDYLVEIKFIKRGFNYGWLKEAALKVRLIGTLYAHAENRLPNTILLIVARPEVWKDTKYQTYLSKLAEDIPRRRGKNRAIYLASDEIDKLSSDEFRKKIGVYV